MTRKTRQRRRGRRRLTQYVGLQPHPSWLTPDVCLRAVFDVSLRNTQKMCKQEEGQERRETSLHQIEMACPSMAVDGRFSWPQQ